MDGPAMPWPAMDGSFGPVRSGADMIPPLPVPARPRQRPNLWTLVGRQMQTPGLPVSAKALVMTPRGRVLILRKTNGLFDLPGGKLEIGEGALDALTREVDEETGLQVDMIALIAAGLKRRPGLGPRLVRVYAGRLTGRGDRRCLGQGVRDGRSGPGAVPRAPHLSAEHDWGAFLTPAAALRLDLAPPYVLALARVFRLRMPARARARVHPLL